jgi:hypothetical protein
MEQSAGSAKNFPIEQVDERREKAVKSIKAAGQSADGMCEHAKGSAGRKKPGSVNAGTISSRTRARWN